MKKTLSVRLFETLQKGKERLGKEALAQVTAFVDSQRTAEEAFMNKNGQPDLYYTLFGWMLSYVLGIRLDNQKTAAYLEAQEVQQLDLIHYAAWVRCRMIQQVMEKGLVRFLFRRLTNTSPDLSSLHGFPNNDSLAPYSQFVTLSLLEDTRQDIPDKKEVLQAIARYRMPEGGYANRSDSRSATTNATVAALAVRGQLDGYHANKDVAFLLGLQQANGGFSATPESPLPDLLTTATALFTLKCYGSKPAYAAADFIDAHWLDSGGFAATLLDEQSDVEYTFYGLLALGAL